MFTDDDTWLSFPIGTPLAFDAAALATALGPSPDAAHHALLAEFSTAMNLVPDGVVWQPHDVDGLDDVVRAVVARGEWAVADRTPAEEARAAECRRLVDLRNPQMASY